MHILCTNPRETIQYAAEKFGVDKSRILSIKLSSRNYNLGDRDYDLYFRELFPGLAVNHLSDAEADRRQVIEVMHLEDKYLIVQHESGLEILYIAGSIASLGGFVIYLIDVWHRIHDKPRSSREHDKTQVVVRRVVQSDKADSPDSIEEVSYPIDSVLHKQIEFNKHH